MRRLLLWCAQNRWLATHVPRWRFARRAVRRSLPGDGWEDALKAAVDVKPQRIGALFTLLGENLTDLADADSVVKHYEEVLAASREIEAEISVKPTQLGLDIDAAAAFANLQRLARAAEKAKRFLWIDMEGSAYTDRTLDLYRRLRPQAPHVGVALQAYLYRTVSDVACLLRTTSTWSPGPGASVRPLAWIVRSSRSRCSTASGPANRSASLARGSPCGTSSRTGTRGTRGTCGGWRSAPPTFGSWPGSSYRKKSPSGEEGIFEIAPRNHARRPTGDACRGRAKPGRQSTRNLREPLGPVPRSPAPPAPRSRRPRASRPRWARTCRAWSRRGLARAWPPPR